MTSVIDELTAVCGGDGLQLAIRTVDDTNTANSPREEIAAKVCRFDTIRLEHTLIESGQTTRHGYLVSWNCEYALPMLLSNTR